MKIKGLQIKVATGRGDGNGRICYHIANREHKTTKVAFPTTRKMKNLARKYLDCEYEETSISVSYCIFFMADTGIKPEQRNAFLAAVATHCKFKKCV